MMEEKKTIFNYIGQAFATFGIIVTLFIAFSLIIGESSGEYSTLFVLGKEGLTIATLLQLLILSVLLTVSQTAFLTDVWIRSMSASLRNILFFTSVMAAVIVMVIVCRWFPLDDWKAWAGFIVSFALCTVIGVLVSRMRERAENARMQEALEKYNRS